MATQQNSLDGPPVDGTASVHPATRAQVLALGVCIVLLGLVLFAALLWLWPRSDGDTLMLGARAIDRDGQLLLIVMLAGALGSFIHAATSFGDFVGNDKLTRSWLWWYLLKPFIGAALALVFYLAIRGGFLSADIDSEQMNHYGVAALAGLSGMFSKQATDKLSEVFTTLFRTVHGGGDAQRKDSLANELPVIADLDPRRLEPATQQLQVLVKGTHFARGAVVRVDDEQRETEYRGPSELLVKLRPDDVAKEGEHAVTVFNPPPGGGSSRAMKFVIAAPAGPAGDGGLLPHEEASDGCDVEIRLATPDEALPPARGGVSAS